MSKHTPAPWFVDKDHIVRVGRPGSGFLMPVKIATGWKEDAWFGDDSDEESRANAHLIAAAPELLEALESVVSQLEGHVLHNGDVSAINTAYAAIAKAKGEAQ
jgi:hypothetical protein